MAIAELSGVAESDLVALISSEEVATAADKEGACIPGVLGIEEDIGTVALATHSAIATDRPVESQRRAICLEGPVALEVCGAIDPQGTSVAGEEVAEGAAERAAHFEIAEDHGFVVVGGQDPIGLNSAGTAGDKIGAGDR